LQVLAECRAAIQGDAELDDLRDATLARYLRHNSWVVEPAIKQMKEYLVSQQAGSSTEGTGRKAWNSSATCLRLCGLLWSTFSSVCHR
jgi:hypothetical protein